MNKYPNNLVYVIEKSSAIKGAINLFLSNKYDILTFDDYESFDAHMQKQTGFQPYILIVESSIAKKITYKNNVVIVLAKDKDYSNTEHLVIKAPFYMEDLNAAVRNAQKSIEIISNMQALNEELKINHIENNKIIKV